ncbi:MAG: phage tail protein [Magnetovibrionaceae bacterium]
MKSPHLSAGLGALGVAALAVGLVAAPNKAEACQPDPYIASICLTANTYCPEGYFELNGGINAIAQFTTLFALIGDSFGGNGTTTFAVPDLRGREMLGQGDGPGLLFIQRAGKYGFEQEIMHAFNTPAHTHQIDLSAATVTSTVEVVGGAANTVDPTGAVYAESEQSDAYSTTSNVTMGTSAFSATAATPASVTGLTPSQGGAEPFGIIGPQLGVRACIAWDGTFPPRQ